MFFDVKATNSVEDVLKNAASAAKEYNNGEIATEYIFYGLASVKDSIAGRTILKLGISAEKLFNFFKNNKVSNSKKQQKESFILTKRSEDIIDLASNISKKMGDDFLGTEHLLFAIATDKNSVAVAIMEKVFHVTLSDLRIAVAEVFNLNKGNVDISNKTISQVNAKSGNADGHTSENSKVKENSYLEDGKYKFLEDLGENLTEKFSSEHSAEIIGRENEINKIKEILLRKGKNTPLIIGEPGVGKTAVVEGFAQDIAQGKVTNDLKDVTVFSLDTGSIVAGTRYRGELESKLKSIIDIASKDKKIILFIDEIHSIMQAGGDSGEVSPSEMLKPYIARGAIRLIGATTIDEYKKYIQKDKALDRRFNIVEVKPTSVDQTKDILIKIKSNYEKHHGIKINEQAIDACVELSNKYIDDRNFPDKAIDLMDNTFAKVKNKNINIEISDEDSINKLNKKRDSFTKTGDFESAENIKKRIEQLESDKKSTIDKDDRTDIITADHVKEALSEIIGTDISDINVDIKNKLKNLTSDISKNIIGQEQAVKDVSNAIKSKRLGLGDDSKPIAFMFVGHSGVGKTEFCNILSKAYFGNDDSVVRFNMSEYSEKHSVAKFLGAPAGYAGYDDGGALSKIIGKNKNKLILFDEIEKAHSSIYNLMLQILDEGKATLSNGKDVYFKNNIIIFTSNTGAKEYHRINKEIDLKFREFILKQVEDYFPSEFLNRLSVIVFNQLSATDLLKISKILIDNLNSALQKKYNISLKLTNSAIKAIIKKSLNPRYGARPLKKTINENINDMIVNDLIQEKNSQNSQAIVDYSDDKFSISYS